jgi:hypothetical protein
LHRFCFVEMNTRLRFEHLVDAHDRTWMPDRATATGGRTEPQLGAVIGGGQSRPRSVQKWRIWAFRGRL